MEKSSKSPNLLYMFNGGKEAYVVHRPNKIKFQNSQSFYISHKSHKNTNKKPKKPNKSSILEEKLKKEA